MALKTNNAIKPTDAFRPSKHFTEEMARHFNNAILFRSSKGFGKQGEKFIVHEKGKGWNECAKPEDWLKSAEEDLKKQEADIAHYRKERKAALEQLKISETYYEGLKKSRKTPAQQKAEARDLIRDAKIKLDAIRHLSYHSESRRNDLKYYEIPFWKAVIEEFKDQ